jgi:lipid II:glycine glycyltransferase (peptidoglycan interpeptide bridge formation enzyme)
MSFKDAMFEDLRQSDEWAEYLTRLGWQVVKRKSQIPNPKIYVRKLPLIGALAKIQRPAVIPPIEEIDRVAQKHRALFVKLEPGLNQKVRIKNQGFESDKWPLLPSRTIWLDITPDKDTIWANFSKDARYSIKKAKRLGVFVKIFKPDEKSLPAFYKLFKETGRRKKFWVPPLKDLEAKVEAFKGNSLLILAYHHSEPVAGALILFYDHVAYYHHAAASKKGRHLLAAYLIIWEAIKRAKERDCQILDLEGIYDPRYKIYRRWKGISIFKRKFGGEEVEYPGTYIKYYNPIIKWLFRSAALLQQKI